MATKRRKRKPRLTPGQKNISKNFTTGRFEPINIKKDNRAAMAWVLTNARYDMSIEELCDIVDERTPVSYNRAKMFKILEQFQLFRFNKYYFDLYFTGIVRWSDVQFHFPVTQHFTEHEGNNILKPLPTRPRSDVVRRYMILNNFKYRSFHTRDQIAADAGVSVPSVTKLKKEFYEVMNSGDNHTKIEFGINCGLRQNTEERGIIQSLNMCMFALENVELSNEIYKVQEYNTLPSTDGLYFVFQTYCQYVRILDVEPNHPDKDNMMVFLLDCEKRHNWRLVDTLIIGR